MKTYAIIVTLFLLVGCAHLSNNSSAIDIDGTWRGEIDFGIVTGIGKLGEPPRSVPPRKVTTDVFFNFKRDGDTVKGTLSGKHLQGKLVSLDDIEIKGNNISFTVASMIGLSMMMPEQKEIVTKYMGKIKGEKIKLNIITERPVLPEPGSQYSNFLANNKRYDNVVGRFKGRVTEVVPDEDTPEKIYITDELTIERISKIPENPVN